ncbi:MAG: hypothetical protein JO290_04110 [Sphingomonadaceae bacterium]|nr:hypothetical protein [Sphingomonadaceae bacterium]
MTAPLRRTTRQHRSGNSFSVRIPRDMAFPQPDQELEIEAVGETLVLRPKRRSFEQLFRELDALGPSQITDDAFIRPEWPEHRSPK